MLHICVFVCLCYLVLASVIPRDKNAVIVRSDYKSLGRGNYQFSYITSNGMERYEIGRLVNETGRNEHIVVQGFYSYKDPDGITKFHTYIADDKGYRINLNPLRSKPDEENLDVLTNRLQPLSAQVVASLLGG